MWANVCKPSGGCYRGFDFIDVSMGMGGACEDIYAGAMKVRQRLQSPRAGVTRQL